MTEIRTLADELRNKINSPKEELKPPGKKPKAKKETAEIPAILETIRTYDNADHKSMVHVRFDAQTLQTMNYLKMATGVDVTRLVAFSVHHLFQQYPELKIIIKQFIQNVEL